MPVKRLSFRVSCALYSYRSIMMVAELVLSHSRLTFSPFVGRRDLLLCCVLRALYFLCIAIQSGNDKPLEQTALATPPSRDHDHAMRNTTSGVEDLCQPDGAGI